MWWVNRPGAGSTISFQRVDGSRWRNARVSTSGACLPRRYLAGIQPRQWPYRGEMQSGSCRRTWSWSKGRPSPSAGRRRWLWNPRGRQRTRQGPSKVTGAERWISRKERCDLADVFSTGRFHRLVSRAEIHFDWRELACRNPRERPPKRTSEMAKTAPASSGLIAPMIRRTAKVAPVG